MIHLYWHTTPPAAVEENAQRWRDLMENEYVNIWTPDQIPDVIERAQSSIAGVHPDDRVRHVANVARWHLLARHGGIWADADVTPIRSIAPILSVHEGPWTAAIGTTPAPFVCGGPPVSLWERALDASLDHPEGSSPDASGGRLLQTVLWPGELALEHAALFAEHDAQGRPFPEPPGGRYTTHQWATSSQRYQAWAARERRMRL